MYAFIFMKCYLRHLICHSLVNVQRSVSVDVCCHHPLSAPPLPLPLSIPSPLQVSHPHFSSQLFLHEFPSLNPAPSPPVVAPHAVANFELPPWIPASSWRCPGRGASLMDVLHRALGCSSRACERWAGKGGKVEHWWKWGRGLAGTEICSLTTRCHGNRSLHNLHFFSIFVIFHLCNFHPLNQKSAVLQSGASACR